MFGRYFFILLLIPLICCVTSNQIYGQPAQDTEIKAEPSYPAYYGPKKSIAVTKFDNKVKGVYGNWDLGEGFAEMLTTELIKTGRFVVVERQALQDVVSEQELGQTGLVRKETAAKVGELLGANIIVRGVVSEFEMNESGGGGGLSIGGVRLGLSGSNAHVAVDIRLIDTNTGQVLHSHNAVGKARSSGVGVGLAKGNVDFNAEGFKKTPLGQAMRQSIHDAVSFITREMEAVPFTALVIKSDGNKIYINAGSAMNIKPGDRLDAYSKGEEIIDPATGLNLGSEEALVGTVEVIDIKDKYSIGNLLSEGGSLKRGDILKFR
ncbi:MAG: hypothetical protein HZC48_00555 [Nitrospirae bacterium]|nr:hypothetical protein [Nitrospirota bacterium]